MTRDSLGLIGYDSYHFAVENLPRSRAFYTEKFDFREVARAGDELTKRTGQESVVFAAGDVRVCVSTPLGQNCKAARYLRAHPAGVMSLSFQVEDLDRAWAFLDKRGATFLDQPTEHKDGGGSYRAFEIATPIGDVNFRFIERRDYRAFAPGFEPVAHDSATPNRFGIQYIDHATSNLRTMTPLILWYKEVLGFERYWEVSFHTEDVSSGRKHGSGLRSIVMWDPGSGIKFATNEPLRPFFRDSQINKFVEDNAGAGVQHIALCVKELIPVVQDMKQRGVVFLDTPGTYYDQLPKRLEELKVGNIKEPMGELRRLGIQVDGRDDKYMLQIFMKEAGSLYHDQKAGPFFYEFIQRGGHPGFGEGNFRALFEAIERDQFMARDQPTS